MTSSEQYASGKPHELPLLSVTSAPKKRPEYEAWLFLMRPTLVACVPAGTAADASGGYHERLIGVSRMMTATSSVFALTVLPVDAYCVHFWEPCACWFDAYGATTVYDELVTQ